MKFIWKSAAMWGLAGLACAQAQEIDFAKQIYPILQDQCIKCHGPDKEKGDLRLDSKERAMSVIEPGNPEESELFYRISLPADDIDIMPPKGDTLPKEQVELFRKWIAQGAEWTEPEADAEGEKPEATADEEAETIQYFTDVKPILDKLSQEEVDLLKQWVRQQGGDWPTAQAAKPEPVNLEERPVTEAEKAAMAQLQETGALVMRVAQNANWIRANFRLVGEEITDETIAPLADMPNLIEVDLSQTQITDAGLRHLAGLPNLTHLNLNNTAVTDQGLAHLKDLENLTYLNLYGTQVTDQGIQQLAGMTTLHKLHIWQTEVTDQGVAKLRESLPAVQVIGGWDLDSVQAAAEEDKQKEEEKNQAEAEEKPEPKEEASAEPRDPTIAGLLLELPAEK